MTVYFIGAGPGAADLITVRGLRTLESVPVCLYAGSLVPRELLEACPPGARLVDTANLTLDEIIAELTAAHREGHDVARLHSGDPSLLSAVAEQMRRLDAEGVPYEVVPGVPAWAPAAAAREPGLTVPRGGPTGVHTPTAAPAPAPIASTQPGAPSPSAVAASTAMSASPGRMNAAPPTSAPGTPATRWAQ